MTDLHPTIPALEASELHAAASVSPDRVSTRKRFFMLVCVLLPAGCASFPTPTDSMASANESVRGAEELGAEDVPQAALKLQLAREEIAKAKALVADGENEPAFYQALRASNDAELAIALVREDEARKVAEAAADRVDTAEAEVTP
jgi:hypothetical protein